MTIAELMRNVRDGRLAAGVYPVFGPSPDVAALATATLDASARRQEVAYFLVSGAPRFRVPCFRGWLEAPAHRLPEISDVVLADRTSVEPPRRLIGRLERQVLDRGPRPSLVLVEVIARPAPDEANFVHLLLTSLLRRHVPVLVLVHQFERGLIPVVDEQMLQAVLTLHMAGGRLRETEWRAAEIEDDTTRALVDAHLVDRRRVGSSTWYVCADPGAAQLLAQHASSSAFTTALNRAARAVKGDPWYPVLRIAARQKDLASQLAAYSLEAVSAALFDDPHGLAAYFQALRRAARSAGAHDLERVAAANQIATRLLVRRVAVSHVRRALRSHATVGPVPDAAADLWFIAGQALLQGSDPETLNVALAAFERSRECVARFPVHERARFASRRAAIANGEALAAFKQRRFITARQLEESALAHLALADSGPEIASQRVLIGTHLGDIHLRGLANPHAAIWAYRAAFDDALACPTPDALRYVAPRLAAAELACGQPFDAARVLRELLVRVSQAVGSAEVSAEPGLLKAQLALADAYLQAGRARSAAACYWSLLRWPERLAPNVASGLAMNLRRVHPGLKPRHERLLDRLLSEHAANAASASRVRSALLAA